MEGEVAGEVGGEVEGEVDVRETCLLVRWWLPLGWHFHLECGWFVETPSVGSWRER